MKHFHFPALALLGLALLVQACKVSAVSSGDLVITPAENGFHTAFTKAGTPLFKGDSQLATIRIGGKDLAFRNTASSKKRITDAFGGGICYVFKGESVDGPAVLRELTIRVYDDFPSTALVQATFRNASGETLLADGWTLCPMEVKTAEAGPYFWSFQGQSTTYREDWLKPIGEEFSQRNFMGMNNPDYGGGVPAVCLWRRDAGVMTGHIEPTPEIVSLPVVKEAGNDYADISLVKEFDEPVAIAPDAGIDTYTGFIHVYEGDCFRPLRNYAGLLDKVGVEMPVSVPEAYETAWCAWGYERRFTIDEILGTLPKVKELGFKWATLDDGYQIAEGDWDLTRKRFPNGDADMKRMVDEFHRYGLKAELWWAPLAADPGTEFLSKYPNSIILGKDGKPQLIDWWFSWTLSPVDEDVLREQSALVHKFIADYGFDGLKLDGQHMNAVAPDYSPAHHPEDPEKSSRELPHFYELIHNTARAVKPHAVLQYCPCGDCFSVYNLPYIDKAVSSDPTSSYQIRTKGYVLRALAPKLAYYGDHIELSDGGNDFPTQLGIGAVIGTKFTWPKDNPYASQSYLLTPEKEALLRNALAIYEEKGLALGEYVPGLYDIGFDYPETHVISRNGNLYYAFYAGEKPVSSVELRGLEKGCTYRVTDYYNHRDLGTVTAGDNTVLEVPVDGSLLIEVSKDEGATVATLKAHPELLTGTDYVCPMDKLDATPAPAGYKPFYISHYGRHGARYAYQAINYDMIGDALAKADKEDNLTEFGKDFKARFDRLYPQVEHRAGDLSRVGWQQQQDLSALTYATYPEVFPDGARVRAVSSPSLRSTMTMSSYCLGIQKQNPKLVVTESVADVNLPAILPLDSRNPFPDDNYQRTPVPFKETRDQYAARNLDPHAVLCRLFKNPAKVVKRSGEYELAAYLYFFASGMNSIDTDLDFMDLFTFDEKLAVWRIDNFDFYTGAWRHHLGYKPVVDDIKARANECIVAGGNGADLRFAHDYTFLALLMCLDIDGYGREAATPEEIEEICQSYRVPMGANLYFVLYRKDGSDDILFKVLLNGEAAHLPLPDALWPYYHWSDFNK